MFKWGTQLYVLQRFISVKLAVAAPLHAFRVMVKHNVYLKAVVVFSWFWAGFYGKWDKSGIIQFNVICSLDLYKSKQHKVWHSKIKIKHQHVIFFNSRKRLHRKKCKQKNNLLSISLNEIHTKLAHILFINTLTAFFSSLGFLALEVKEDLPFEHTE